MAGYVNDQGRQTMEGGEVSPVGCALSTALNIADQHLKEKESGENLRQQIKDRLEENAQLKMELHQAKHPRQDKTTKK